jgi:hypothetical protein
MTHNTPPSGSFDWQQLVARLRQWLRAITPPRWRRGTAVVPVVRLAGIIGFSTPLRPGLTLSGVARTLDKRLGIERRVYTAGEHKVMLDPFQPEKPADVERLQAIQKEIHEIFINLVKTSRGTRLAEPEAKLFSGEYWTGRSAVELGLVDRIGELRAVLRERYGEDVLLPLISSSRGWFGRLAPATELGPELGLAPRLGFADEVLSAIEARAMWARFGL